MLILCGLGTWFKKLVQLPIIDTMGNINQNAKSEMTEIKENIDLLLNPNSL